MTDAAKNVESIIERFYHWEREVPERVFLRQPKGDNWHTLTYAQAGDEARRMVAYLEAQGLKPGDHVGILSKNCYHWVLADLAIMMGGFVSVPYYASLPKPQLEEVLQISDVKAVFVGKLDAWDDKGEAIKDDLLVIKFPHYNGNAQIDIGIDWNEIVANTQPKSASYKPDLDDLWTIKFTSGTTGTPKGVMHSHRTPGLMMADEKESGWIGVFELPEVRTFSYLPLNHVGERMGVEVPTIFAGGTMSFAESLESFATNIQQTQPTLFFGVPRIWTKFYLGVIAKMPVKKLDMLMKIPLISSAVKNKLLYAIGMKEVKVAATGAAITPAFIKDFYKKLGIHLIEAYGMTETCGSFCNSPDPASPDDSVGQVLPGAEIKIDSETQEILMKTPYMMLGYYKNPEKTAEVLVDGWMHSGDKGTVDENGFVRVTGRVSDAFKTAKGSYVVPNPIEEALSKNEYIEQVCVAGLGLPQPIALINLSEQATGLPKEQVGESILNSVSQVNDTRAKFERISTAVIVAEPWSETNGLLTPTLKVRRGEVDNRYSEHYLEWHRDSDTVIFWS